MRSLRGGGEVVEVLVQYLVQLRAPWADSLQAAHPYPVRDEEVVERAEQ